MHDLSDCKDTRESELPNRHLTGFRSANLKIRASLKTLNSSLEKTNQVIITTGLDVINTADLIGCNKHHFRNFGNHVELSNKD